MRVSRKCRNDVIQRKWSNRKTTTTYQFDWSVNRKSEEIAGEICTFSVRCNQAIWHLMRFLIPEQSAACAHVNHFHLWSLTQRFFVQITQWLASNQANKNNSALKSNARRENENGTAFVLYQINEACAMRIMQRKWNIKNIHWSVLAIFPFDNAMQKCTHCISR